MSEINAVVKQFETILNRTLDNVYISTGLKVFIGLYAAFAAPKIPPTLVNLFDNILVRIGVAFVIVLMATKDASLALLTAVAFIMTLQTANQQRLWNTDLSVSDPGESSWLPSARMQAPMQAPMQEQEMVMPEQEMPEQEMEMTEQEMEMPEQEMPEQEMEMPKQGGCASKCGQSCEGFQNVMPMHQNNDNSEEFMSETRPSENFKDYPKEPVANEPEQSPQNVFTSQNQFLSAQDNTVPGANQNSCVKSWENQHCIQGIQTNAPNGF